MHTDSTRPATKANSTNRRDWSHYGLALGVLCMLAVPARAQMCTEMPKTCTPAFNLSAFYGGQNIKINECFTNATTSSQCAWADAAQAPISDPTQAEQYFLACSLQNTGPIALCYYSGMPGAPYYTPSCTFSQNGNAAECYCYEISANNPKQNAPAYSYVEMTGILNEDVYNDTVNNCVGSDGSIICLNLSNLSSGLPEAPVCTAIKNKTLFPGANVISDFSQIQIPQVPPPPPGEMGSFMQTCPPPPPSGGKNLYAGCMTAPCTHTNKTDPETGWPLDRCTCPTFNGPNQVGNPQIQGPNGGKPYSCSPTFYVWSSAYLDLK
jgi:hypothetical protein